MPIRLVIFRFLALLALGTSMAALVDVLRPEPLYCGFQSGCEEVTGSAFGHIAGVPLPVVGLVAFGGFFLLTLFPSSRPARLLGPMAVLAGVAGLALLLVQAAVLKRFCRLCLLVDACALGLALVELATPASGQNAQRPRRWLWLNAIVLVLAAPVVWALVQPPPPIPVEVLAHWVPGKVTVVLVTDFACPGCRQTHPVLADFLKEKGKTVHLVSLVFPLPQSEHGRDAARAWHCALAQSKGEVMAEALFAADDLSSEGCERIAARLGLDLGKFRKCVSAPATDAAINRATGWVPGTGLKGLPILWVQDQTLVGVQTRASLEAAFQRARRRLGKD
jgi:protein-disulfide isomerase/uncharacterized membrane protein